MEKLFEIASNVSTPLALGGLVAMSFFLLLRQILRMNIFPQLSQTLGSDVIKLIIKLFFVFSLVALVLGVSGYIFTSVYRPPVVDTPSANLPSGLTVRDAAMMLVKPEGYTVEFLNCDEAFLKAEVLPGPITGKSKVEQIENLPLRLKDSSIKFKFHVIKSGGRGRYEISCN